MRHNKNQKIETNPQKIMKQKQDKTAFIDIKIVIINNIIQRTSDINTSQHFITP